MIAVSFLLFALIISTAASSSTTCSPTNNPQTAPWSFRGPAGYIDRDDPLKIVSAGAINQAASSGDSWYVASVNGGVWKTSSTFAPNNNSLVSWVPVLDHQPVTCSSMTSVVVSTINKNIVFAACGGSTSSEQGYDWNVMNSGDWGGVMVSTDGGATWNMTAFPLNYYVTSVLPAGSYVYVAAQSNFNDKNDGGVWRAPVGSIHHSGSWARVSTTPTFALSGRNLNTEGTILAARPRVATQDVVIISHDGFRTVRTVGNGGLDWQGRVPFYTCLAISGNIVFLGALTVNPQNSSDTGSAIYWTDYVRNTTWTLLQNQPQNLDQDAMPKDRMGLLVDPDNSSILYVVGNAASVAYRVMWKTNVWTSMIGTPETTDNSAPHVDCRNAAWDATTGGLVVVSDGGIFIRDQPKAPGGRWRSLNGDIGEMEFLTAHWDVRNQRWVAGAQDNEAQVSQVGAPPKGLAIGFVDGDGTLTAVDNSQPEPRLFGTIQFLGTRADDKIRKRQLRDDDGVGLAFLYGVNADMKRVFIPLAKLGFTDPQAFPYFVHPFTLNTADPTSFVFWANGTEVNQQGFYSLTIPPGLNHTKDLKPPKLLLSTSGTVLTFVSGGVLNGATDASLLIGMNNTHFYYYTHSMSHALVRQLPTSYAAPLDFVYNIESNTYGVGPVTHGKTVSLAVHPLDARVFVVTGWPSIVTNTPPNTAETIWITYDSGSTWKNVFGNLTAVSGTIGKVRPSGLLLVRVDNMDVLLVGTTRGVYYTPIGLNVPSPSWRRLGTCDDFPLVVVMGLSYEERDDTLVAATFGRGVYSLPLTKVLRGNE